MEGRYADRYTNGTVTLAGFDQATIRGEAAELPMILVSVDVCFA
jgi:hypothetical protein